MTATAIGGPLRLYEPSTPPEVVPLRGDALQTNLVTGVWYGQGPQVEISPFSYHVMIAPARLSAVVSPGDEGFIAESVELGSLGYGDDVQSALADLREAVRDYLAVLKEKGLKLAPAVAQHAAYVTLLDVPEDSWFASVRLPKIRDAADVE